MSDVTTPPPPLALCAPVVLLTMSNVEVQTQLFDYGGKIFPSIGFLALLVVLVMMPVNGEALTSGGGITVSTAPIVKAGVQYFGDPSKMPNGQKGQFEYWKLNLNAGDTVTILWGPANRYHLACDHLDVYPAGTTDGAIASGVGPIYDSGLNGPQNHILTFVANKRGAWPIAVHGFSIIIGGPCGDRNTLGPYTFIFAVTPAGKKTVPLLHLRPSGGAAGGAPPSPTCPTVATKAIAILQNGQSVSDLYGTVLETATSVAKSAQLQVLTTPTDCIPVLALAVSKDQPRSSTLFNITTTTDHVTVSGVLQFSDGRTQQFSDSEVARWTNGNVLGVPLQGSDLNAQQGAARSATQRFMGQVVSAVSSNVVGSSPTVAVTASTKTATAAQAKYAPNPCASNTNDPIPWYYIDQGGDYTHTCISEQTFQAMWRRNPGSVNVACPYGGTFDSSTGMWSCNTSAYNLQYMQCLSTGLGFVLGCDPAGLSTSFVAGFLPGTSAAAKIAAAAQIVQSHKLSAGTICAWWTLFEPKAVSLGEVASFTSVDSACTAFLGGRPAGNK